ncbi:MAG TPA: hypothetical protein PKX79_09185 [Spirochaetota bacterium]|jgi:hypothetical protein|nr:hypothetical protein [Spirochaetota bacterium]OQA99644.1 MAG: hypothetical protein BWY23_00611 [Spirochaetes bacterium ADurb.Bin218]HOK02634.1 hypothetical protein [Spirochaetota bacterium]HOK92861.1 hypothetical protein [Spirochaetota bacterium]HON15036.1 hypothetical protein [Spirochaetota bacterium]
MEQKETLEKLQQSLKRKEQEAMEAKNKGMSSTYGNLIEEINLIKSKMKKLQMGMR